MVKNAMDFGQFSPGVYSAAQYGIPAVPYIRGDLSQIYMGGQQIPFSRNSTPPSFNGVDALGHRQGPRFGHLRPAGRGRRRLRRLHHEAAILRRGTRRRRPHPRRLGRAATPTSNPEAHPRFRRPDLSDKLAYRVSYLSRYGDGYYLNDHNQTQDVYVALTYLPTSKLKIEGWVQGYADRINEIAGVSRVTEDFIRNGNYIAGPAGPTTSGPNAYFGYDIITVAESAARHVRELHGRLVLGGQPRDRPHGQAAALRRAHQPVGHRARVRRPERRSRRRSTSHPTHRSSTGSTTAPATRTSRRRSATASTCQGRLDPGPGGVPRQVRRSPTSDNSLITGVDFRYMGMTSYQDYQTEPVGLPTT